MTKVRFVGLCLLACAALAISASATDVYMKISGPGAVNDSTIKAGQEVSFDLYYSNSRNGGRGFSTGFVVKSPDIKKVVHVADSTGGLTDLGDIKGHNGWQNTEVWDFAGVWTPSPNWDGALPDTIGFAGAVVKKRWNKHESVKAISLHMIFEEPGTVVFDSTFVRPGTEWMVIHKDDQTGERWESKPGWGGPYTLTVVE